jgi:hypothetical protein
MDGVWVLDTPPVNEPLDLVRVKNHLRVSYSDDDGLILGLIQAARGVVEQRLERALVTQTWNLYLDWWPVTTPYAPTSPDRRLERPVPLGWPDGRTIWIPRPNLQTVNFVKYWAPDQTQNTLPSSSYWVAPGVPGRIVLNRSAAWPALDIRPGVVWIQFICGYGTADQVPESIKSAMLLMIGNWYLNRESVVIGTIAVDLPSGVEALLASQSWGWTR